MNSKQEEVKMAQPRNVRNFFVEGTVDGRKTEINTGPIGKDGGIWFTFSMREDGEISPTKLAVSGEVKGNGVLVLRVMELSPDTRPRVVWSHETIR